MLVTLPGDSVEKRERLSRLVKNLFAHSVGSHGREARPLTERGELGLAAVGIRYNGEDVSVDGAGLARRISGGRRGESRRHMARERVLDDCAVLEDFGDDPVSSFDR